MKKALSLILCVILSVSLLTGCFNKNTEKLSVKLWFLNAQKTGVEYEEREIIVKSGEKATERVMEEFLKGPEKSNLKKAVPENVKLNSVISENDLVTVDFSKGFILEKNAENLLIRTCVFNTLISVDGVNKVRILVEGKDITDSNGKSVGIINKGDIICDEELTKETYETIKLYFAADDMVALETETRDVTISQNETTEMKIIKELIKGPEKSSSHHTIPTETKILSVETKDGVCFVNLSQEFINKNLGSVESQTLSVYSIVNSLTELKTVDKVQFLIEGQKVETFIDMIFNEPFKRDDGLVRK